MFYFPESFSRDRKLSPYVSVILSFGLNVYIPGDRFSKDPGNYRARKAIFSSSVSNSGEVYTPETSCMKRTSVHIRT